MKGRESRDEKTKTSQQGGGGRDDSRERVGGGGAFCVSAGTGRGRRAVALLGQRRPEGTTTHFLFAIVLGKERRMEE